MISHLLKAAQGGRAAETGEKTRALVELKRPAAEPRPFISERDLKQTTDMVSRTADAMAEMARRNEAIEAEARKIIEKHRRDSVTERQRASELQAKVDALQARIETMARDHKDRVSDLEAKLASCRADLDLTTRDAELARQWLVYLSTEIAERLGDAPGKLEELARETRVGLGLGPR